MRAGIQATAIAGALVLAALGATSATAATGDAALAELDAAASATAAAAQAQIDVIQLVTYRTAWYTDEWSPATSVHKRMPAGSRVRVHATADNEDSYYVSLRKQPGTSLIGAQGTYSSDSPYWASVSMLTDAAHDTARANGLSERTSVVNMRDPSRIFDAQWPANPRGESLALLLPPYAGSSDEGWQDITTTPQADGTTLISGRVPAHVAASDGEETCTRPLVEMVVGPDHVVRSSHWVESCPGRGTREVRATATFTFVPIQSSIKPRVAAEDAFR